MHEKWILGIIIYYFLSISFLLHIVTENFYFFHLIEVFSFF